MWIETISSILSPCRLIPVTPHVGVWIETSNDPTVVLFVGVTPHVGVWIETRNNLCIFVIISVTPHVGVWIETFSL